MKEVLQDERSVILTDAELLIAVNHRLEPKDRVSFTTFKYWKSPTQNIRSPEVQNLEEGVAEDFRQQLAFARVEQKMNLTGTMLDANSKNQWGSSWILERKFEDLKLKQQLELPTANIIQISATNDEHKDIINNILEGKTIELETPKDYEIIKDEDDVN